MHHFTVITLFIYLSFSLTCDTVTSKEDHFSLGNRPDAGQVNDGTPTSNGNEQATEVKVWDWQEMELPALPWQDETRFGKDFYVDSAFDPLAVSKTAKQIRFYIDPIHPSTSHLNSFNYRAEIHTAPWPIKHALGTEQWLGWTYTFGKDYVIDPTSPITIFQNHPGVNGLSPQIELELAALDTPSPAQGGEVQIINEPNGDRLVTDVKPLAGDRLSVVVHIVYGIEDQGRLTVWLNGKKYYHKKVSTVYPEHPWGGNNKWGLYHHTFNNSPEDVESSLPYGGGKVELFMGTLRTLTRTSGHPDYMQDAYELIRPEN